MPSGAAANPSVSATRSTSGCATEASACRPIRPACAPRWVFTIAGRRPPFTQSRWHGSPIPPAGPATSTRPTSRPQAPRRALKPCECSAPEKMPPDSAVRLAPAGPVLGVAEGIETALAAQLLFGFPVWACLSAGQLTTFEPTIGTQRLVVCGDNDADGTGQRAAYTLA